MVVWDENRPIVDVFTRCRWRTTLLAGPTASQRVFEGIDATEIAAVAAMLRVPPEQHADLLWGVRIMEHAALPVLNRG